MSKLEDIGFYTLSDRRAKFTNINSPLQRCEMILTGRCSFSCPYCRGIKEKGDLPLDVAKHILNIWKTNGLRNIRFTGGEPTLYPYIRNVIREVRGLDHIALSTNGYQDLSIYEELIDLGVNDLSISLDSGCCSAGDILSGGIKGSWEKVTRNIEALSALTYVTVGMVFTEDNVGECVEAVKFASSLGVADIRVIPAAQYDKALTALQGLPNNILEKHPILRYRVNSTRHVRGIKDTDCKSCPLSLDDMVTMGENHYPCIIHLREGGEPIGKVTEDIREDRLRWYNHHNTHLDPICKKNCLDVCVAYNNKADQ